MRVTRAIDDPELPDQSWAERWEGRDSGLIAAWTAGVELSSTMPDLFKRASAGELPELPWKGGVRSVTRAKKWGPLLYVAMLQGLKRQPLDIDTTAEITLTCSATGSKVTFTNDRRRWAKND